MPALAAAGRCSLVNSLPPAQIFKRSSRALESSASQPSSSPSPRLQSKPQAPSPKPIEMPLMRKSASSWQLQAMYEREVEMEPSLARKQAPPKPPRHASEPQCARVLRALWQRELRRPDVGLTADFFDDLGGSDEQALALVREMQLLGFHISAPQFFALPRSSVYTVLLVAL